MAALLEPRMRLAAAAERLAEGPAAAVVEALAELVAHGGDPARGQAVALDAVVAALSSEACLGYERRAELYEAAVAAGRRELALLLIDAAPPPAGTESLEREAGAERALTPRGRRLALGERKALARGHRRHILLQLMRDPHPDVVAVLVDNPHLTESDVLRVASRRPMLPRALVVIAASDRWRVRAAVRRALVQNPYTPLPLAARLMTTLSDGDLAPLAGDPGLAPRLREHAADLLAARRALR
jgi:hypothetical protein